MQSKLAISALVAASLFGATAIASAQTQPAPGASSEGNVGPGATDSKMKSGKMKSSKMKSGTTTGMSTGAKRAMRGVLRAPVPTITPAGPAEESNTRSQSSSLTAKGPAQRGALLLVRLKRGRSAHSAASPRANRLRAAD